MQTQFGIILNVMLLGLAGCGHSTSDAGGQTDASRRNVSSETGVPESAIALAARAMDVSLTQAERREAATRMTTAADPDAAIPNMRSLLATSDDEFVRATMAKRLGDLRDMDSSPQLLDALGDASPQVQEAAAHSLLKMLGRDFFFRSDDLPEFRQAAQARYRKYWEDIQSSPATRDRLRERNQQLRREQEQQDPPHL